MVSASFLRFIASMKPSSKNRVFFENDLLADVGAFEKERRLFVESRNGAVIQVFYARADDFDAPQQCGKTLHQALQFLARKVAPGDMLVCGQIVKLYHLKNL